MTDKAEDSRKYLMRRAFQAAPYEICGFILKDGTVIEIPNSSSTPTKSFAMHRLHLCLQVPNPELIKAIWHSHPNGSPEPSAEDIRCAKIFAADYDWQHLIVTADGLHEYSVP